MAEARRALLDESTAARRFYTISAAIINANDETRLNKEIRAAGLEKFHATHADEGRRRAMETLLVSNRVQAVVSVCAPMMGSPEVARQQCLAALATTLRDQYGITELVMDSREDLKVAPRLRVSRPNERDSATIDRLNLGHRDRIELRFADDQKRPALTLADAAAWRTRRALANDSISAGADEFARLAPVTRLLDASGQPTIFQKHLDAFKATSLERTAVHRLSPDREVAFHQKWDSERADLSNRVHEGAPDWAFYFASPDRRQPPAPQAASVWDVFAGKGTTPTIRPEETQTATGTVARTDAEAERRRTRTEDTREQRGHNQQRRPAQAEPERTRHEDPRRTDRQPDRQRQEQRRQADQHRDQDRGRGRGLTR